MRFPSIGMPSLGLGDRFDSAQTRRVALYVLYTVVLFAVFMLVNFPYLALVDRQLEGLRSGPLRVEVAGARFAWWHGLELLGVRLIDADFGHQPLLEIPRSYLRPSWLGLMRGQLASAELEAEAYGGRTSWQWSSGSDVGRVQGRLEGLQVGRHRALMALFDAGQISGLLSGEVDVEIRKGDASAAKIDGQLSVDGLAASELVYRGTSLLDLGFDDTTLKFSVQGGRVEIEELNATGPDLEVSASGQIGLRQPVQDSVLNLRATVTANEGARPEIKGLVSLIPRPKGARANAPIPITGTLAQPRVR
jgi:type II secretion system protein N